MYTDKQNRFFFIFHFSKINYSIKKVKKIYNLLYYLLIYVETHDDQLETNIADTIIYPIPDETRGLSLVRK